MGSPIVPAKVAVEGCPQYAMERLHHTLEGLESWKARVLELQPRAASLLRHVADLDQLIPAAYSDTFMPRLYHGESTQYSTRRRISSASAAHRGVIAPESTPEI